MEVQFAKWGNSLALRIPSKIAMELGISAGSTAEINVKKKQFVVTPRPETPSIAELIERITPENLHSEFATGESVGAEVID